MNNKLFPLLIIAAVLAGLYFLISEGTGMIVWAYCIMAAGLYYGKWIKEAVIVSSLLATFFVMRYVNEYAFACIASAVLFFSVIPIPFYFANKTEKEKKDLSLKNSKLKEKYTDILAEHSFALEERQEYEDKIERMMQLYIAGRDLSKIVLMEEYVETVLKDITGRYGVISANMFKRERGEWIPLAFSKFYQKNDWVKYIAENRHIGKEQRYTTVTNPSFCVNDESTVFWPLKIENELLGCIFIVTEKTYALRYVEEGAIFSPQISLGLKRVSLFAEMSERSRNDGLTGLYLRRYFMERLQSEIQRERRYSGGFYILMLDIDYFKNVNDKYGHLTGDKVLCAIAKILVDCVRPGDLVGRYGGEEFIVLMPMASYCEAKAVAQEINEMVDHKKFRENDETFGVTISVGVSNYPKDGNTIEKIVEAADKALYKAKQDGRNRVVVCGQ